MSEIETLQGNISKLELAKRKQDISVFQQIVEPLAEAIEELSEAVQMARKESEIARKGDAIEQNYFDKDFNKNISSSLTKIVGFLTQFKQDINIDLSPINSIAAEIKKQNETILTLLSKANNGQSDEIYRLVSVLISKQSIFLERSQQTDYSTELKKISEAISNKDNRVQELTLIYNESGDRIRRVVPVYKNK